MLVKNAPRRSVTAFLFFFVLITNNFGIHSQSSDTSNTNAPLTDHSLRRSDTVKPITENLEKRIPSFSFSTSSPAATGTVSSSSSSSSSLTPFSRVHSSSSISSAATPWYTTSAYFSSRRKNIPTSSFLSFFSRLNRAAALALGGGYPTDYRPNIAATPDARAGNDGCWSSPYRTACKYLPPNGENNEQFFYTGPDYPFLMHSLLVPVFTHNFTLRINVTAINNINPDVINGLAIVKVSLGGIDRRDGTGNILFPNGCLYSSPVPVMDLASGSTTLPSKPYVLYDITILAENGQNGCWFGSRYEYLVKLSIEGFATSASTVASTNFRYTIQTWIDGYVNGTIDNNNLPGYYPNQSPSVTPSPYWWDLTPTASPDYNSFYGNDPDNNAWWLTADISSPTPSSSSSPIVPMSNLVPPDILPLTLFLSLSDTNSLTNSLLPGQSHLYYVWSRLSTNNNPLAYSSISSSDPDTFSVAMDNYVGYTLYLESNNTEAVSSHILTIRSGYIDSSSPFSQWGECTAVAHNEALDSSSKYVSYLTLDVTYDNGCYYGAPSVYYIRISYDETKTVVVNDNEPLMYRLSGNVMNPSATTTPTPSITPSNTPTPSTTGTLTSTSTSTHTATVTPSVTPTGSTTMIFRSIVLPSSTGNTNNNLNITDNGLPDIFKNGGLIINRDNTPTPSPNYGPSDLLDAPFGGYGEGFTDPVTNTRTKDTSIVVRSTVDYNQPKYYRMTTTRDMGINLVWLAGSSSADNQPVLIEAALYGPPTSINSNFSAYQWLPQFIGKLDDPINITDIENTNYTLPMIVKGNTNVTMGMSGTLTITRCELAFALGYPCDERFSGLYRTLWFRIRVLRPSNSNRRQLSNNTNILAAPPPVNIPGAVGVPFSFAMDWNYNDGEGTTGIKPSNNGPTIDLAMLIPTIIGVLLVVSVGIYIFVIGPAQVREIRKQRMRAFRNFLNSSSSSTEPPPPKSILRSPPSKAHLSAVPSISMYGKPMLDSKTIMHNENESLTVPEMLVATGTVSKEILSDILIKPTVEEENDQGYRDHYHRSVVPSKVTNQEWSQYGEQIIDISDNFEPAAVISLSEQQQQQEQKKTILSSPVGTKTMDAVNNNPLSSFDAELIATIHEAGEETDGEVDFDTDEKIGIRRGNIANMLKENETNEPETTVTVALGSAEKVKRTRRVQYSENEEESDDGKNHSTVEINDNKDNDTDDDTHGKEKSSDDMFTRILHKQHPSMYVGKKQTIDTNSDNNNGLDDTVLENNNGKTTSESATTADIVINDSSSVSSSSFSTTDDAASLLMARTEQELQKTGSTVAAAGVGLGLNSQNSYYTLPTGASSSSSSSTTGVSLPRRKLPTKAGKVPRTTGIIIPPIVPLHDVTETVKAPKVSTADEVFGSPESRRGSDTSLAYDDILDDITLAYPRSEYASFAESEVTNGSGYSGANRQSGEIFMDNNTLADIDSGKIPSLEEMRQQQQQAHQRRGVSFSSSSSFSSSASSSAFSPPLVINQSNSNETGGEGRSILSSNVTNSPPMGRGGSIISSSNHHRHLKVLVSRTTDRTVGSNGGIGQDKNDPRTYETSLPVLSFAVDKHGRGEVPRPPGLPAEFKPTPVTPSSPSRPIRVPPEP